MLPFQITQFSRYFSQDREITSHDAATEQGAMVAMVTVVTVSQADIIRAGLLLLLLHSVQV